MDGWMEEKTDAIDGWMDGRIKAERMKMSYL